ncbi:MAG: Bug family tripartite tricarboxylate transporter substrate binding protein, partial [Burkholderiales bacterium]
MSSEHRGIAGGLRRFLTAAALACAAAGPVAAQPAYPQKPVRLVVPFPPGGGADLYARTVMAKVSPVLGQPIVIENRPGSGTLIGTEFAAKADPDGYTLLLGALANIALNPGLYRKLPYDPKADFVPIGLAVSFPYTLVA